MRSDRAARMSFHDVNSPRLWSSTTSASVSSRYGTVKRTWPARAAVTMTPDITRSQLDESSRVSNACRSTGTSSSPTPRSRASCVERIVGDVQVEQIEPPALVEERRAEERRRVDARKHPRQREDGEQRDAQQNDEHAAHAYADARTSTQPTPTPTRAASRASSAPMPPTSESVTYGSTVICSSLMYASAAICRTAARSPTKSPTATPATMPIRIWRDRVRRGVTARRGRRLPARAADG